eukprot:8132593-Pyramimonas_sp.AAC.1
MPLSGLPLTQKVVVVATEIRHCVGSGRDDARLGDRAKRKGRGSGDLHEVRLIEGVRRGSGGGLERVWRGYRGTYHARQRLVLGAGCEDHSASGLLLNLRALSRPDTVARQGKLSQLESSLLMLRSWCISSQEPHDARNGLTCVEV